MVFVGHDRLVERSGAREAIAEWLRRRMRETRVLCTQWGQRTFGGFGRPRLDDARKITQVVRDRRRGAEHVERIAARLERREERVLARELVVDCRCEPRCNFVFADRNCAPESARADRDHSPPIPEIATPSNDTTRAETSAPSHRAARRSVASATERARVHVDERVMADAHVDVGWNERRDGRGMRSEERAKISRPSG